MHCFNIKLYHVNHNWLRNHLSSTSIFKYNFPCAASYNKVKITASQIIYKCCLKRNKLTIMKNVSLHKVVYKVRSMITKKNSILFLSIEAIVIILPFTFYRVNRSKNLIIKQQTYNVDLLPLNFSKKKVFSNVKSNSFQNQIKQKN